MAWPIFLLIAAFILFILLGLNVSHPRVNLLGWGLACLTGWFLFAHGVLPLHN
jgi:hypothetical protein